MKNQTFISNTSGLDYELLDCGNGRKLEKFGKIILDRPEINAVSYKISDHSLWDKAHFKFIESKNKTGKWVNLKNAVNSWEIACQVQKNKYHFLLELTKYKHLGLFPEQYENWNYISDKLNAIKGDKKVLNLFAYTGGANVVAAGAGAQVTHIDSVKQVTNWARNNAELNDIKNIRWIVEDARKFVLKSIKRGDQYQGVILDPPTFGYGSKKEIWTIEKDLKALLIDIKKIVDPRHYFIVLNTYSPNLTGIQLFEMLKNASFFVNTSNYYKLGLRSNTHKEIILGDLFRSSNIK